MRQDNKYQSIKVPDKIITSNKTNLFLIVGQDFTSI